MMRSSPRGEDFLFVITHVCGEQEDDSVALTKERKNELVAEYTDLLENSKGVIFTEYRGLGNKELTKLRRAVRESNGSYLVAKLSLLRLALEQAGYPIPDDLEGAPLAVGFCLEEVPSVAKAFSEFAEKNELLVLRGGIVGGKFVNGAQVEALADLPPLDVLRAQIIGLLDAPASNIVGAIQAGVSGIVNVLHAYAGEAEGATATE
jgi:large subunit ribosomal protein L10